GPRDHVGSSCGDLLAARRARVRLVTAAHAADSPLPVTGADVLDASEGAVHVQGLVLGAPGALPGGSTRRHAIHCHASAALPTHLAISSRFGRYSVPDPLSTEGHLVKLRTSVGAA